MIGIETFRRADNKRLSPPPPPSECLGSLRHHRPYRVRWRDRYDRFDAAHGRRDVTFGAQGGRERGAGKKHLVDVTLIHAVDDVWLASPERDLLALAGQQVRQCGAPGTAADHCDLHLSDGPTAGRPDGPPRVRNRFSVPAINRLMFRRCA